MAESLGAILATVVPLALVIALSPLTVVPAILVLHSPRPRPTSLAFLGGWVVSLIALTVIFVSVSSLLGGQHRTPPEWAGWVRIVLGVALILFGAYRWFTRNPHTEPPRWMRPFTKMTPVRAGLTGLALAPVRPEALMLCATAGVEIGTGGAGTAGTWLVGVVFVAVSASTVAVPVVSYAAAGDRLDDTLKRLKDWMEHNHGAMEAAIFVAIGLMVVYKGISAL